MTARVDPAAAHEVAAAYAESPTRRHPLVIAAYAQLAVESDLIYRQVTAPDRPGTVRVVFTTCPTPYDDAWELIRSVRDDRLLEVVTIAADRDRRHPLLGSDAGGGYDRFRAVHDIVGHARLRLGFDRHSEFACWRSQAQWHTPLAGWALATELHGQHSVLWTTGQLAEPKAVLLDPRLLRRSAAAAPAKAPRPASRPTSLLTSLPDTPKERGPS